GLAQGRLSLFAGLPMVMPMVVSMMMPPSAPAWLAEPAAAGLAAPELALQDSAPAVSAHRAAVGAPGRFAECLPAGLATGGPMASAKGSACDGRDAIQQPPLP